LEYERYSECKRYSLKLDVTDRDARAVYPQTTKPARGLPQLAEDSSIRPDNASDRGEAPQCQLNAINKRARNPLRGVENLLQSMELRFMLRTLNDI